MIKFGSIFILFIATSTLICCKSYVVETFDTSSTLQEIDSTHNYRIELGKQLFYDPILSRDSTVSCATCHKQELAFTDGLPQAIGIRKRVGTRNSPTLANVKNRPYLLLDGVNPSLESQAGAPIQEHSEFDFNILLIIDRIKRNELYAKLTKLAFDREVNEYTILKSIAEFERTLISDDSPYDRYLNNDKKALSKAQKRGKDLFMNKLYCAECHSGPDLTDDRLTNNGLYENYEDAGRMRLTEKQEDHGVFKVPTLRNIALTAPYMHNGSLATLDDVLDHYMSGGENHDRKGVEIVSFELTVQERSDLLQFFYALTDSTFITNPDYGISD